MTVSKEEEECKGCTGHCELRDKVKELSGTLKKVNSQVQESALTVTEIEEDLVKWKPKMTRMYILVVISVVLGLVKIVMEVAK